MKPSCQACEVWVVDSETSSRGVCLLYPHVSPVKQDYEWCGQFKECAPTLTVLDKTVKALETIASVLEPKAPEPKVKMRSKK